VAGWGRLDLDFINAPAPYALWLDDHSSGLVTGQAVSYTHTLLRPLEVLTDSQPLRVMLVWTDPPASLSASAQLVNDLDLVVAGPGGATYYGNDTPSGDRTNNVEGVIVNDPPLGRYQVRVSGYNVPVDSQPYALAVAGPFRDTSAPSLTVIKTADTGSAVLGQTITYTYRVANSGDFTLTHITGHDDKLGPLAFSPATLNPGQSTTRTLTYTVQASDLPGPLANTVSVSGDSLSPPLTVTATDQATVNLFSPADIGLVKMADVGNAQVGQTVTYVYRATNNGTLALTSVTGYDDRLGLVTLNPSTLAPGQSAVGALTYTVQMSDLPGPLVNTARVSGTTSVGAPLTATDTASATVDLEPSAAAIGVVKAANVGSAVVGQTVTYVYWVTNGGALTLTNVIGRDDRLGPVTFNPSTLAPGQSAVGTLIYTVQDGDLPGPLVNTVNVSGTTAVGPPFTVTAMDTATVDLPGVFSLYLPVILASP
jgi:uncharacterized repeat protein (TIGR01451 family)